MAVIDFLHGRRIMPAQEAFDLGAPGMIRTCDARFRKPTLYPLSYGGWSGRCYDADGPWPQSASDARPRSVERMRRPAPFVALLVLLAIAATGCAEPAEELAPTPLAQPVEVTDAPTETASAAPPSTPAVATPDIEESAATEQPDDGLARPLAPPSPAASSDQPDLPDPDAIPAGTQEAIVTWIIDGDTIDVEVTEPGDVPFGDQRIRLLEIDTPERDEECYETATDLLAELIPVGSTVYLERDTEDVDPNGRYLRYVWSEAEGLVNLDMVAEGMAAAFVFPLNRLHEVEVETAEANAQDLGLGIWGSYCDGRP